MTTLPREVDYTGKRVEVIFGRDVSKVYLGTCVEDTLEDTVILLDDGRTFHGYECQYRLAI